MDTGRNRRRNLRARVELPVAWRDLRGGEPSVSTTVDVSASGLAMHAEQRVPRGRELFVVVGHEELGLRFEATAKVERSAPTRDGYSLFLSFVAISAEAAAAIGRYVVRELARERAELLDAEGKAKRRIGARARKAPKDA